MLKSCLSKLAMVCVLVAIAFPAFSRVVVTYVYPKHPNYHYYYSNWHPYRPVYYNYSHPVSFYHVDRHPYHHYYWVR